MTAAHSVPQDRQAEQRANEPSMEEILASIRRIIADDQAFTSRAPASPPEDPMPPRAAQPAYQTPPAAPLAAVSAPTSIADAFARDDLNWTRSEMDEPLQPPAMPKLAPLPERMRAPAPVQAQAAAPASSANMAPETPLVSPKTDAAVSSAFGVLVASQFMRESEILPEMVREMLRPMLKMWLDDNLPVIVERLVRVEIERVARGPR